MRRTEKNCEVEKRKVLASSNERERERELTAYWNAVHPAQGL